MRYLQIIILLVMTMTLFVHGENSKKIAEKIVETGDSKLLLDLYPEIIKSDDYETFLDVAKELSNKGILRSQVLTHFFNRSRLGEDEKEKMKKLNILVDYYTHTVLNPSAENLLPQRRGVMVDSTIRGRLISEIKGILSVEEDQDRLWESSELDLLDRVESLLKKYQMQRPAESESILPCLNKIQQIRIDLTNSRIQKKTEGDIERLPKNIHRRVDDRQRKADEQWDKENTISEDIKTEEPKSPSRLPWIIAGVLLLGILALLLKVFKGKSTS